MSFLKRLFGGTSKQRTYWDEFQDVGGKILVAGYRKIAAESGLAPTAKTTDKQIIEIYSRVGTAFQEAAKERGEHIPALTLNYIVFHFLQFYETNDEQFFQQHIQYEVNLYLKSGLRSDYKNELKLF